VGPRAGLEAVEKRQILPLPGIEAQPSSRSPSLYQLSYPNFPFKESHSVMSQIGTRVSEEPSASIFKVIGIRDCRL
jgi:hypothetical protein